MVKLALTLVATLLLLMYENAIARAARWVSGAAATQLFVADFGPLKTELVQKSALAIVLLLGIAVLGIYKPWGLTAYGHSKLQKGLAASQQSERVTPLAVKIFYAAASLLELAILVHLTGHSLGHRPLAQQPKRLKPGIGPGWCRPCHGLNFLAAARSGRFVVDNRRVC